MAGVTCVWAGADSGWEQEKLEARKMLDCLKGVPQNPTRPVHLGMMAGDHFPRENALLSTQGEIKSCGFEENDAFSPFPGDVLRTLY